MPSSPPSPQRLIPALPVLSFLHIPPPFKAFRGGTVVPNFGTAVLPGALPTALVLALAMHHMVCCPRLVIVNVHRPCPSLSERALQFSSWSHCRSRSSSSSRFSSSWATGSKGWTWNGLDGAFGKEHRIKSKGCARSWLNHLRPDNPELNLLILAQQRWPPLSRQSQRVGCTAALEAKVRLIIAIPAGISYPMECLAVDCNQDEGSEFPGCKSDQAKACGFTPPTIRSQGRIKAQVC